MAKRSTASSVFKKAEHLRLAGVDQTAAAALQQALDAGSLPVVITPVQIDARPDYTQIDPSLTLTAAGDEHSVGTMDDSAIPLGIGYAGLTAVQRARFLVWAQTPHAPAPPAVQQLYLANLEVRLFEANHSGAVRELLLQLQATPAWRAQSALARTLLLGFWLAGDGPGLANWIAADAVPAPLLELALGLQALLHTALTVPELPVIARAWQLSDALLQESVLALRLDSLRQALDGDPLALALAQLGAEARTVRPWRCAHRDLRIAFPQPALRATLTPLLKEIFSVTDSQAPDDSQPMPDLAESDGKTPNWHLILEFGHSRSEFFDTALRQAQRMPGYSVLMDEHRRLVYRIVFTKGDMNKFWRLWDYVQSWGETRVYANGKEVPKWGVWPHSPQMR